jgi:hypothetical protein
MSINNIFNLNILNIKIDYCNLSSTGLQDIDTYEIIADNITILSNLNVGGTTLFI